MIATIRSLGSLRFLWASVALVVAVLLITGIVEYRAGENSAALVRLDESEKMEACRNSAIQLLKPERMDIAILNQVSDFCYTDVRRAYLMSNYNIYRYNIVKQQFQTMVVMWMVVIITLSGVFLAGMQLLGAYRLASIGQGQFAETSDLNIERSRISLKSSMAGLLILVVSLAFFIVYIKWVYLITPDSYSGEATTPMPVAAHAPSTSNQIRILPGIGGARSDAEQAAPSVSPAASDPRDKTSTAVTPPPAQP